MKVLIHPKIGVNFFKREVINDINKSFLKNDSEIVLGLRSSLNIDYSTALKSHESIDDYSNTIRIDLGFSSAQEYLNQKIGRNNRNRIWHYHLQRTGTMKSSSKWFLLPYYFFSLESFLLLFKYEPFKDIIEEIHQLQRLHIIAEKFDNCEYKISDKKIIDKLNYFFLLIDHKLQIDKHPDIAFFTEMFSNTEFKPIFKVIY